MRVKCESIGNGLLIARIVITWLEGGAMSSDTYVVVCILEKWVEKDGLSFM